uniref:Uncharacterized protein n=1 Tax=Neisseria meningitidis alpha153 TaxID=663926 RepID=C6SFQ4_NEIME|nr:hypothetical protein predicted by Glimmer/Critica [Neisseria meningitidis alpha153]
MPSRQPSGGTAFSNCGGRQADEAVEHIEKNKQTP